MPASNAYTESSQPLTDAMHSSVHLDTLSPLLGTDQLVDQLRKWIPGGLSKRLIYQWCDLGCPHIEIPGQRLKFAFVLAEVVGWVLSHRGQKPVLSPRPRRSA